MNTCYKPRILSISVANMTNGKRVLTIPIKVSEEEKAELLKISHTEDRPVGYIVRELMKRGLALYEIDGKLKESAPRTVVGRPLLKAKADFDKSAKRKRA